MWRQLETLRVNATIIRFVFVIYLSILLKSALQMSWLDKVIVWDCIVTIKNFCLSIELFDGKGCELRSD